MPTRAPPLVASPLLGNSVTLFFLSLILCTRNSCSPLQCRQRGDDHCQWPRGKRLVVKKRDKSLNLWGSVFSSIKWVGKSCLGRRKYNNACRDLSAGQAYSKCSVSTTPSNCTERETEAQRK